MPDDEQVGVTEKLPERLELLNLGRHLCVFSVFHCGEAFPSLMENKPGIKSVSSSKIAFVTILVSRKIAVHKQFHP